MPKEGKDEAYDGIMEEIAGLEKELEDELQKLEEQVG